MPDNFDVYIKEPTNYRFDPASNLVYAEDQSGNVVFRRVMSVQTLRGSVQRANRILDQWAENRGKVVPMRGKKDPIE